VRLGHHLTGAVALDRSQIHNVVSSYRSIKVVKRGAGKTGESKVPVVLCHIAVSEQLPVVLSTASYIVERRRAVDSEFLNRIGLPGNSSCPKGMIKKG
jgi:hypothetical protein